MIIMNHRLNILLSNKILIFILIIFQKLYFYNCQIYDNFTKEVLEEGSQLIDVNDYNNLNLIVTTLKNIYIGIPPKLKAKTEAKLINTSSIITLNSNYLLAACLQDSLLTKINLNDGNFTPLLNYYSSFRAVNQAFQILCSPKLHIAGMTITHSPIVSWTLGFTLCS